MPNLAKNLPIKPVSAVKEVNAMPATAVGNAKGSSIIPSKMRFNGNLYRTSTHAKITPITALIAEAMNAVSRLTRKLASTLGRVRVYIISDGLSCAV